MYFIAFIINHDNMNENYNNGGGCLWFEAPSVCECVRAMFTWTVHVRCVPSVVWVSESYRLHTQSR